MNRNTQHLKNKICKSCNKNFSTERFESIKGSNGKTYKINTCRLCRANRKTEVKNKRARAAQKLEDLARLNKWKNQNRGTIAGFIYSNLHRWRKRSITKCGIESDLTFNYLVNLWHAQNGKCHYSGIELDALEAKRNDRKQLSKIANHKFSPSLDRIIPSKGYIRGNVVWCAFAINSMKGDLTEIEFIGVCSAVLKNHKDSFGLNLSLD